MPQARFNVTGPNVARLVAAIEASVDRDPEFTDMKFVAWAIRSHFSGIVQSHEAMVAASEVEADMDILTEVP